MVLPFGLPNKQVFSFDASHPSLNLLYFTLQTSDTRQPLSVMPCHKIGGIGYE